MHCRILKRSEGGLASLESSHRSVWAKMLRALGSPLERYGVYDSSADWFGAVSMDQSHASPEYLSCEEYVNGLRTAVASVAAERGAVLHGHAGNLLAPKSRRALHVFTGKTFEHRAREVQNAHGTDLKTASALFRKDERSFVSVHRGLFGIDPMDQTQYDICGDMDHLSVDAAAQLVAGAARSMVPSSRMSPNWRYASRVTAPI